MISARSRFVFEVCTRKDQSCSQKNDNLCFSLPNICIFRNFVNFQHCADDFSAVSQNWNLRLARMFLEAVTEVSYPLSYRGVNVRALLDAWQSWQRRGAKYSYLGGETEHSIFPKLHLVNGDASHMSLGRESVSQISIRSCRIPDFHQSMLKI